MFIVTDCSSDQVTMSKARRLKAVNTRRAEGVEITDPRVLLWQELTQQYSSMMDQAIMGPPPTQSR